MVSQSLLGISIEFVFFFFLFWSSLDLVLLLTIFKTHFPKSGLLVLLIYPPFSPSSDFISLACLCIFFVCILCHVLPLTLSLLSFSSSSQNPFLSQRLPVTIKAVMIVNRVISGPNGRRCAMGRIPREFGDTLPDSTLKEKKKITTCLPACPPLTLCLFPLQRHRTAR